MQIGIDHQNSAYGRELEAIKPDDARGGAGDGPLSATAPDGRNRSKSGSRSRSILDEVESVVRDNDNANKRPENMVDSV